LPLTGALLGQSVPVGLTPSFSASADRVELGELDFLDEFVVVDCFDDVVVAVVDDALDGVVVAVVDDALDGVLEATGADDCAAVGSLGELLAVGSSAFFPQLARARTASSAKVVVQRR
jgi:hypothetical protein